MKEQIELLMSMTHCMPAMLCFESLIPGPWSSYTPSDDDVPWSVPAQSSTDGREVMVAGQAVLRTVVDNRDRITLMVLDDLPDDLALMWRAMGLEKPPCTLSVEEFDRRTAALLFVWHLMRFSGMDAKRTIPLFQWASQWGITRGEAFDKPESKALQGRMASLEADLQVLRLSWPEVTRWEVQHDPRGASLTLEVRDRRLDVIGYQSWKTTELGVLQRQKVKKATAHASKARNLSPKPSKVDPKVVDVLRNAELSTSEIHIAQRLTPKLWSKVAEFLVGLGAQWHTGKQSHVFEINVSEKIRQAIDTGECFTRKDFDFFWTPEDRSGELAAWLELKPGMKVLEPQAGRGALALAAAKLVGLENVTVYELMPENVSALRGLGFSLNSPEDFLEVKPQAIFDAVLMNPPFSGGRAQAHTRHAFEFLAPGGRLVTVLPSRWRDSKLTTAKGFESWTQEYLLDIRDWPAGVFSEAGTDIETQVLLLRKPLASSQNARETTGISATAVHANAPLNGTALIKAISSHRRLSGSEQIPLFA